MERRDVLTGDPLRLDGAARGAAALRRLDAASTRVAPLEDAARGLAALTRVRLTNLTSPARGDGALVDVLARLVPAAGAGDGALDAPAPRRLGVPVLLPSTARVQLVAHDQREAAGPGAGQSPANARPVRFRIPEPLASRRRMQAAGPETQHARALPQVAAVEAPAAPRGFEVAESARGLEWLAVRVPGGAESSETPLVDGAPEASPARRAPAVAAEPATATRALPVPDQAATVQHEFESGPETRRAVQPLPRTTGGDASHRRLGGGQGLDALVRAWQDTQQPPVSSEQAEPADEPVASASADRAQSRSGAATRTRTPESRASEREEETLVFGDALARVLVGELRRYGIEVDVG